MFDLPPKNRLNFWKSFRRELDSLPLNTAATKTQQLWQSCPFTPFYLDPDHLHDWPDPWQLITENYYCDLAKTLGIIYTLHLSAHKEQLCPELHIYLDSKTRYHYHIAYLCHGKYVLNLAEDEVVNKEQINQELKLKYCYTAVDLKLEKY